MSISVIDVIIVIFVVSSIIRGYKIGLIRQAGSTIGFVAGLFIGSWISNSNIGHVHGSANKSLLSLLIVLAASFIFMSLGELGGIAIKRRLKGEALNSADGGLGSVMAAATTLFAAWLIGSILVLAPTSSFQQSVKSSHIISALNHLLPPATQLLGSLNKLIDPNGFPQVFTGLEPHPKTVNLPSLGSFNAVVAKAQPSVVKLEGTGCGGIVEGSGFVTTSNTIATNAHVVAGVANPKVIDTNGVHSARVIWFDKNLDLAVLQVSKLAGKPLAINTTAQASGTPGVVLGYPGGGDFNAQPASVLDDFIAVGRDIYGQGLTRREVYSLQAHIIPGNSGGPLLGANGSVLGLVFATSTQYNNVGYALTGQQIASELTQAERSNTTYSTGSCSE